jgi:hypothetical protein
MIVVSGCKKEKNPMSCRRMLDPIATRVLRRER